MSETKAGPRMLTSIFYVFNTKLVIILCGLAATVFVSRALGAEGRGLVAAVLIYPQLLLSVFEGGMRQASIYFLGKRLADESQILGAIVAYTILSSAVGYSVAVYMMMTFEGQSYPDGLLLMAALLLPISLCVSGLRGYFLGRQNISGYNRTAWVEKMSYSVAILLLYMLGYLTVANVLYITIAASIINLGIGLTFFVRSKPARPNIALPLLWKMMKSGAVYAIGLFLITANYQVDILLLSWLAAVSELGQYTLTVKLAELLWQLPAAIVVVLVSKGANTDAKAMVQVVSKICRLTLLITMCSAIGLWVGCYYLVVPVFGADFTAVASMVGYILPGIILATVFKSLNSHYAGQGRPHYAVYIMGASVTLNIGLNLYLIPNYGGVGAALASSVSYGLSAVLIVITFCRTEGVPARDVLLVRASDFQPLVKMYWKLRCPRLS